jgi:iron complex transport system substrate-binding protein
MSNRMGRLALAAALLSLGFGGTALAEKQTLIDDMGRKVTLDLPVKRAAIFNAYNVEFFRSVGAVKAVAGIDGGTLNQVGYWPEFGQQNVVGNGQTALNYEKIVELKPDVVILPRNGAVAEAETKLAPFGIPVFVLTGWDTVQHVQNLRTVGVLTGRQSAAEKVVDFYQGYVDLLTERLKGAPAKTVYLEKVPSLFTAVPGSGWHDMIALGGGKSIFGDVDIAKEPSSRGTVHQFEVTSEAIVTKNPDVIIKLAVGDTIFAPAKPGELEALAAEIVKRPGWGTITAVKAGQVHVMASFAAGGSSKIIGTLFVAKALYPERFKDVDPEAALKIWIEDFQGVPFRRGYSYSLPNA